MRSERVRLRDNTLFISLRLDEVLSDFLDIAFIVDSHLFVVTHVVDFEELTRVHPHLDHVGDFFETLQSQVRAVEDQMLEHLLDMAIKIFA